MFPIFHLFIFLLFVLLVLALTCQEVGEACSDCTFRPKCELLLGACDRVGHWARWTEGCWCHEALLTSLPTYAERKAALEAAGCPGGVDLYRAVKSPNASG